MNRLQSFVSTAAQNLKPLHIMATQNSVLTSVSQQREELRELMTNSENVLFVKRSSLSTNTRKQNTAPVYVISVIDNGDIQPVYNLAIDVVGKYYANGILVHNCDALRYIVAWLTTPTETTQVVYMPLSITDTY